MDDQDLVSVCTVKNLAEAEIIRGALQSAGIACQIGGMTQAGLAGVLEIDVLTHVSDVKKARKLLRDVRHDKIERKKKRIAAKKAKAAEKDATSEAIQEKKPGTDIKKPPEE
jgi:Putative prokaryotic signal transducing protein